LSGTPVVNGLFEPILQCVSRYTATHLVSAVVTHATLASAGITVVVACLSICLSVCHASIMSKRLKVGSRKQRHVIAQGF